MKNGRKDLLIQSLPNTGSTWFAECAAKGHRGKYFYEYFNPLRNPRHEQLLSRSFGCETVASYANIASPGSLNIDEEIELTWGSDDYSLTKEVFSPFKLPTFTKHFHCVVFLRSEELVFPPSRLRIVSFYEHAWWAIQKSNRCDVVLQAVTAVDRAREAFRYLSQQLAADAEALGVPVIRFEELFGSRASILDQLSAFGGHVDAQQVAAEIEATRRMPRADRVPS